MINAILGICFLVLVVFNIVLYHKIFDVVYFDLGKGLLKEIVGSFIVASLEIGLIMYVGKWILGMVSKVLVVGLKFIIIIVGISIITYTVYYVYKLIKKHKENAQNDFANNQKVEDSSD
ncbi:MAG: hypothetical protein HFH72_05515 [Lachnospiraceae bacterium]|nr:hypothetical protein [Lachnospiraceae bacterium]